MDKPGFRWVGAVAVTGVLAPPLMADSVATLPDTVVRASALASRVDDLSAATTVLQGEELTRRRSATLGDTLSSLPGIHSRRLGPGGGRAVNRALAGSRVEVLSDGADVLDACTSSSDHAIAGEMELLGRIEVMKGPATVMDGGGAIGGVVNLIDRRVPTY